MATPALLAVLLSCASVGVALVAQRREGALSSQQASTARAALEVPEVPGRVTLFFLILARDRLANEGIWTDFFEQADTIWADYAALVHCTDRSGCMRNIQDRRTFRLIGTVPSRYCSNLVDPMVALLRAALARGPGSAVDRFIFLSDSSVPVKPFGEISLRLLSSHGSWFELAGTNCGLVKASQWSALTRAHAQKMVARRDSQGLDDGVDPRRCSHCLDEHWPFLAVFGTSDPNAFAKLSLGLVRAPTMYTDWSRPSDDAALVQTAEVSSGPFGPATLSNVSAEFLGHLRRSHFLMARKFFEDAPFSGPTSLRTAFRELILQ